MISTVSAAPPAVQARGRSWTRNLKSALPTAPFFIYVAIFLILPTILVIVQSFQDQKGAFTTENLKRLFSSSALTVFKESMLLSLASAFLGVVVGGLLCYALATAAPTASVRKVLVAACSVLAQFGGVMLAFAFIASVGNEGFVTGLLRDSFGIELSQGWLYQFNGFVLVYAYFQIPLMVIIFLPALDGIKPQWREAAETLGDQPGCIGEVWLVRSWPQPLFHHFCCYSRIPFLPTQPSQL
ncbi:ABC transporter permease [Nakamurella antarctica]|uniref:ABC transporter permease n=1 Tax=Nakamurella antarctica TaxID=1902245 RepID=UPI0019D1330B|nr:hypothetical protein [Nakamurella antarctica]